MGTIDAVRRCASPQTRPRTAVGGVFKAGGSPDVRSWRRLRWRRRRRCWHLPLQARPAHRRRMQAAAPPSRQCLSVPAAISPLPRLFPPAGAPLSSLLLAARSMLTLAPTLITSNASTLPSTLADREHILMVTLFGDVPAATGVSAALCKVTNALAVTAATVTGAAAGGWADWRGVLTASAVGVAAVAATWGAPWGVAGSIGGGWWWPRWASGCSRSPRSWRTLRTARGWCGAGVRMWLAGRLLWADVRGFGPAVGGGPVGRWGNALLFRVAPVTG